MAALQWSETQINDPIKGKDLCNLEIRHLAILPGLVEKLWRAGKWLVTEGVEERKKKEWG